MNGVVGKIKELIGFEDNEDAVETVETVDNNAYSKTKTGKVINMNDTSLTKVLLSKPKNYDDAKEISEAIKDKKIVLVNTIGLDAKVAQRLVDFISGACYVLDASVQEVESRIYLLSPNNTEVISEFRGEMSDKSYFNWNKEELV